MAVHSGDEKKKKNIPLTLKKATNICIYAKYFVILHAKLDNTNKIYL